MTQVLQFLDHLYQKYDISTETELYVLYLDFRRAFYSVPHQKLFEKIPQFGIGESFVKLIASYLTNRGQYVKINYKRSPTASVTSGVPQGSIIRPLLFILFINDLPTIIKNSESFGYTDDFKLANTGPCTLQEDINRIEKWCSDNEMKLNSDKCYILPIHTKCEIDHLTLNTNRLSCKKEQKDLGIIMATNLNWKANCDKRYPKAWRAFYFLKRNVSKLANKYMKLDAYKGYVVPVIAYASQAWSANKGEMRDIENIQKRATSWILGIWENYNNRLKQLELLPLSMHFELHDALLLLSIMQGNYNIRKSVSIKNNPGNDIKTRQTSGNQINIEKTRTKKADENFWKRFSRLLNIITKKTNYETSELTKPVLFKIFWNFFERYSEINSCTWRIICNCGNCNSMQKI